MINRLRALLLTGDDADRALARGLMSPPRLPTIARRRGGRASARRTACSRDSPRGQQRSDRLNRGGDRQLDQALHDIVPTRWRSCPRTHAYIAKRRTEGKTDNEIRRLLKRYIVREIYRYLNTEIAARQHREASSGLSGAERRDGVCGGHLHGAGVGGGVGVGTN